jgi:uncharacterized protein YybS (DUF2232 family)
MVSYLRMLVPIEQTILLIAPSMAACALVGWMLGGRLWLAVIWTGLAGWMLMTPVSGSGAYDALARGWALLLAASFGIVSAVSARRAFLSRALSATAIAFAIALALMVFARLEPDSVVRHVSDELQRRLDATTAQLNAASGTPEWREFVQKYPGTASVMDQAQKQLRAIPPVTVVLFPALLAIESLAMLALAWSLYHRASRTRIGAPLRPLSEFRFNDQVVWGLVLGVTLLVVPTLQEARGIGLNLAVVFGLLYALRGLGVLDWFLKPRGATRLLFFIAMFLALPVVGIFSLGLGLGDTWIDWRARARPTT